MQKHFFCIVACSKTKSDESVVCVTQKLDNTFGYIIWNWNEIYMWINRAIYVDGMREERMATKIVHMCETKRMVPNCVPANANT